MNVYSLVWRELRERPWSLLSNSLAILLGVAALVAIRHIAVHSEQEVSRQLATLGANILILPQAASLQDYFAADQSGGTLPEEHVSEIYLAGLTGVEKLSPKLSVPAELKGTPITLTGILPQCDLQAASAWQTVSIFGGNKHEGCTKADTGPSADDLKPEALTRTRSIEELRKSEVVVGADIAERTGLVPGAEIELLGAPFNVIAVLQRTGTVDDSRVFAHLHTVQNLSKSGEVVSAIEVVGCCEDAAGDLVPELGKLLPNAKVVTISQVVKTQVGVNRLLSSTSWFMLGVLVVVGGASLAGTILANVRERRREIGTLMALGATPAFVHKLFLLKALVLGLIGGISGCAIGLLVVVGLGPTWTGLAITPLPGTVAIAVVAATLVALAAAFWPARQAAQLDPCLCFREI